MKALPAIDLRDGACVQLVGGSYDKEEVRIPNPLDALDKWTQAGFSSLHIVDLDAALGKGDNREVVKKILATPGTEFSVGGGVRSEEKIEELVSWGAARIVVGTRALEDPEWIDHMAQKFPKKLVVAADVKLRQVVTRGWEAGSGRDIINVIKSLDELPLAGFLVTAVHMEGKQEGIDLPLFGEVIQRTSLPIYASGGVSTLEDLHALKDAGAKGAVIGMALYTGKLDADAVAKEFA